MMMGKIFVLSSPSGGGKTTIRKHLLKQCPLVYSVSWTTRPPRQGEKDKEDYFFVSERAFKRKIEKSEFAEWTRVLGNYYGTPKEFLEKEIKKGNVLLEIDVKGARQIKRRYRKQAVLIFIAPPSLRELKKRLENRKTENRKEIAQRLKLAYQEIEQVNKYDYLVINKDLKECTGDIKAIIRAEGCKL